jgi:hypothetical protein
LDKPFFLKQLIQRFFILHARDSPSIYLLPASNPPFHPSPNLSPIPHPQSAKSQSLYDFGNFFSWNVVLRGLVWV